MAASGIFITIDATTAAFDRALSAADKSLLRYSSQLKLAQKAQAEFDAAVAASGASSAEAAAAQGRLGAALARTTVAEQRAALAAKQAGEIQAASAAKAAAAQEAASAKQAAALRRVGTVFGTVGTLAAVGLGLAAKAAADFNAKMATVSSLSHASAGEIAGLTQAAHGFADIGVSATDAADAEIELVKAGISAKDIMGGALAGSLNLAAAGQASVADATQIAAVAMTQFQLSAKDVPHLADLLAAGADKALGSVTDLGFGLSQAGLPAHQLGVSVEETVGALAEFAQAGLIGEKGGTVLKQMFLKLEAPSATAKALLDKYNISLYNAQGNFVGLANLAGQLQKGLGGLSQQERDTALATIFGSRAIQGANILYKDGAAGVADWTNKVNDSGFAAQQAAGKMDSLKGDAQKLGATLQNDLIDVGQQLQPLLRAIAQDADVLAKGFGDLPGPVKQLGANMTIAAAAVGLGVFAFTRLSARAAVLTTALRATAVAEGEAGTASLLMGAKASIAANKMLLMKGAALGVAVGLMTLNENVKDKTASGLLSIATALAAGFAVAGPWGAAIGGAAATAYELSQNLPGTTVALNGFTASLDKSTGAATKATHAWALSTTVDMSGILNAAGISAGTFTKALLGNTDAIDSVNAAAKDLGGPVGDILLATLAKTGSEAAAAQQRIRDLAAAVGSLHNPAVGAADAARHLGGVVLEFGTQAETAGRKAAGARGGVDGLGHSLAELTQETTDAWAATVRLNNVVLTRRGDWNSYQQAIDDATAALKANGKTLDATTQKGRDNRASLDSIATSAQAVAKTITNPVLKLKFLEESRQQLKKTAESFGATIPEAKKYVDSVLGIPKKAFTQAILDDGQAKLDLAALKKEYDLTPKTVNTVVTAAGATTAADQVRALLNYENALHDKAIGINVGINYYQTGTGSLSGGHVVGGIASGGYVDDGRIQRFANSGYVRGPGTGTSDSILALLSNGEFVHKTSTVDREGVSNMHALNAGRATIVPRQQFANGGNVGAMPWRGGGTDALAMAGVVAELRALRTDLTRRGILVSNGAEIGGQVRLTANQAVNSHQAQINRRNLAGSSQ